jgi:hypothetical protein
MADLAEVRRILDDAAIALHEANVARGDVWNAQRTEGRQLLERAPTVVVRLREAGTALLGLNERLTLRFGGKHEVVQQFRAAEGMLRELYRAVNTPERSMEKYYLRGSWEEAVDEYSVRTIDHHNDFVSAAAKTVGARLPSDGRS